MEPPTGFTKVHLIFLHFCRGNFGRAGGDTDEDFSLEYRGEEFLQHSSAEVSCLPRKK